MYLSVCLSIHPSIHLCMHVFMVGCMYACMDVCMYIRTYVCMAACMHISYIAFARNQPELRVEENMNPGKQCSDLKRGEKSRSYKNGDDRGTLQSSLVTTIPIPITPDFKAQRKWYFLCRADMLSSWKSFGEGIPTAIC